MRSAERKKGEASVPLGPTNGLTADSDGSDTIQ